MTRRATSVTALAALLAGPHLAHAQTQRVGLVVEQCPEAAVPTRRLRDLSAAELAPRTLLPSDSVPGTDELWARIRLCDGSPDQAALVIEVAGHTVAERRIDLSDVVDDSRARTLAVALSEIVASLGSPAPSPDARTAPPKPRPEAAAPPSSPTRRAAPPRRRPAVGNHGTLIGAGATVRNHGQPSTWLVGPWLSVGSGSVQGELLVLMTRRQLPAGTVSLSNAVAGAAVDVLSVGDAWQLGLRARGELGLAWASGRPANVDVRGQTRLAPQGAGLLESALQAPLAGSTSIEVRASAGVAHGLVARADGASVASSAGLFFGATLGLRYGFGG
ncbi:MAG: hypothetical protein JW940_10105 [Polyangiaceae bacterium]|nr:hypothetical protein [Polyangiaceae bacterium]